MKAVPITFEFACVYVDAHHRHHKRPQGHKFSLAVSDNDKIVGVAIAGRPISRFQDDGSTLEITRLCCTGSKNVCSYLVAKVCRIAKEFGYKKIITYILKDETGVSLMAAGFKYSRMSRGGSWSSSNRKRVDKHPLGKKKLFVRILDI